MPSRDRRIVDDSLSGAAALDRAAIAHIANPHLRRMRTLPLRYPTLRALETPNPFTALVILAGVIGQLAFAVWAVQLPTIWSLLLAYCIGAFTSHALLVLIHEGTHDHVFRRPALNMLASIVANIPLVVPVAIHLRVHHLQHHWQLGNRELDGDLPSQAEIRWASRSRLHRVLWIIACPGLMIVRSTRLPPVSSERGWRALNVAVQVTATAAIVASAGWSAVGFLLLCLYFGTSLHPLGARWLQDHYLFAADQATTSYYGCINAVAFNIGYHNEHHDWPRVPWNRLPSVRCVAADWYGSLRPHKSWTRLLLRFLFDPRCGLDRRYSYSTTATDRAGTLPIAAAE